MFLKINAMLGLILIYNYQTYPWQMTYVQSLNSVLMQIYMQINYKINNAKK